ERNPDMAAFPSKHGGEWNIIHTSGHAWLEDLQWLAEKIQPTMLVPIHSLHGDKFSKYFANVVRIRDKEEMII
ncbi:MBL fold metallo-hydrolase, partial [Candidatus Parcubacteria bacterium]